MPLLIGFPELSDYADNPMHYLSATSSLGLDAVAPVHAVARQRGAKRKDLRFVQIPHNAPTPPAIRRRAMPMLPRPSRPCPSSCKSAQPMDSRRRAAMYCHATSTSLFGTTSRSQREERGKKEGQPVNRFNRRETGLYQQ